MVEPIPEERPEKFHRWILPFAHTCHFAQEHFHVSWKHENALDSCFNAFSSREPVSISLENALDGISAKTAAEPERFDLLAANARRLCMPMLCASPITHMLVSLRDYRSGSLGLLSTREELWSSVWKTTDHPEYGVKLDAPVETAELLPLAREGTLFQWRSFQQAK
jgi:hypothetical protein